MKYEVNNINYSEKSMCARFFLLLQKIHIPILFQFEICAARKLKKEKTFYILFFIDSKAELSSYICTRKFLIIKKYTTL